jgi:hypothetical protein
VPTADEHIKKAQGNETFADSVAPSNQANIDWKLIALFYVAVHYVEAYLAKNLQLHLRSHTTRDNYVGKEPNLKAIRLAYSHLKYFGYNARYEIDEFTAADVRDASDYLAQIKACLLPLL